MAKLFSPDNVRLSIPEAVNDNNITLYLILVQVGNVEWTIKRRYKEFSELHETLIDAGVQRESLPEKKLLGHRDAKFIMKRRRELETYLVSIFHFLQHSLPRTLALFLNLNEYELHQIVCELASEHYDLVEKNIERTDIELGPLQMHAISERFKSPRPPQDSDDRRYDFANVADLTCSMPSLKIVGSQDAYGSSNIIPNSLKYDFLAFKNLSKLILSQIDCSPDKITSLGSLRSTLKRLEVHKSGLTSIGSIFMCDSKDSTGELFDENSLDDLPPRFIWSSLEYLDLRENEVTQIDTTIRLAPKVRTLLLGCNKIQSIEHFCGLPELSILELSDNCLTDANMEAMHTKLGQITRIDAANNKLTNLKGFSKLYSLQSLNVSGNRIRDLEAVFPVSKLPCLESLTLQGNSVSTVVDYRLKVLESFGKRCSDMCLDNEYPSQSEIDKVSILMALRVAKEGKSPTSLFGNLPRPIYVLNKGSF